MKRKGGRLLGRVRLLGIIRYVLYWDHVLPLERLITGSRVSGLDIVDGKLSFRFLGHEIFVRHVYQRPNDHLTVKFEHVHLNKTNH